jgi:hypothetical protein
MCAAPAVTSRPRYRSAFDGWHSLLPRDAMSAHALRSYNPDHWAAGLAPWALAAFFLRATRSWRSLSAYIGGLVRAAS